MGGHGEGTMTSVERCTNHSHSAPTNKNVGSSSSGSISRNLIFLTLEVSIMFVNIGFLESEIRQLAMKCVYIFTSSKKPCRDKRPSI